MSGSPADAGIACPPFRGDRPDCVSTGASSVHPRNGERSWSALVAVVVAAGCTIGDLDPVGMPCPCPDDYVCDAATKSCQPASGCAGRCGTPGCGECPTNGVVV